MLLIPDPDDRLHRPVLHAHDAVADLLDRGSGARRAVRARPALRRAEGRDATSSQSGIADVAYFGPEAEFFVFDHLAYEQRRAPRLLRDRLERGLLEHGRGRRAPARTSPTSSVRRRATSRSRRPTRSPTCAARWSLTMESLGIKCEFHHHEVSSGGQGEIDMRFQPLLQMADQMMIYKYVVKNTAPRRARRRRSCPSRSSRRTGPACTCTSRCGRTASR